MFLSRRRAEEPGRHRSPEHPQFHAEWLGRGGVRGTAVAEPLSAGASEVEVNSNSVFRTFTPIHYLPLDPRGVVRVALTKRCRSAAIRAGRSSGRQIGRPSGRERGCQSVKISGGAV